MDLTEAMMDTEVLTSYPELRIGLLIVPVTHYSDASTIDKAANAVVSRAKSTFGEPDAVKNSEADQLYRDFYRKMGLKAAQISTPTKQAARVLGRGSYSSVSPQVDVAMEIEYATLVSFQLYDIDKLRSRLVFRFARGDESVVTLRGEDKVCKTGELILESDGAVVHSCYYGNVRTYLVTPESRVALVRVMGIPGIPDDLFRAVLSETQERLRASECIVLSRHNPRHELTSADQDG